MGTRKQTMVEKKVKSLVDGEVSTYFESHFVVIGEVLVVKFKNIHTFESYVQQGVFVEAKEDEEVNKIIPIIPIESEVDDSGLPFIGENVDEVGEPEGKMILEDEYQFEPPASRAVEEILFEEQDKSKLHQLSYFDKVKDENKPETNRPQI